MLSPISHSVFATLSPPEPNAALTLPAKPAAATPKVAPAAAPTPPAPDKSIAWSSLTPAAKVTTVVSLGLAVGSLGALAFATIATAPIFVLLATLFLAIAILAVSVGKAAPRAITTPQTAPTPPTASVARREGMTTRLLDGGVEPATAPGKALASPRLS